MENLLRLHVTSSLQPLDISNDNVLTSEIIWEKLAKTTNCVSQNNREKVIPVYFKVFH